MDELFGRKNFVSGAVWQKKFAPQNDATLMDVDHDHILIYAINKEVAKFNLLPRSEEMNSRYLKSRQRSPWALGVR